MKNLIRLVLVLVPLVMAGEHLRADSQKGTLYTLRVETCDSRATPLPIGMGMEGAGPSDIILLIYTNIRSLNIDVVKYNGESVITDSIYDAQKRYYMVTLKPFEGRKKYNLFLRDSSEPARFVMEEDFLLKQGEMKDGKYFRLKVDIPEDQSGTEDFTKDLGSVINRLIEQLEK